jgi:hypothetical protein
MPTNSPKSPTSRRVTPAPTSECDSLPAYKADNGPLTNRQLGAIGKLVPQGKMTVTSSLLQHLIAEGLASGQPIEVTLAYWATKRKKLGV